MTWQRSSFFDSVPRRGRLARAKAHSGGNTHPSSNPFRALERRKTGHGGRVAALLLLRLRSEGLQSATRHSEVPRWQRSSFFDSVPRTRDNGRAMPEDAWQPLLLLRLRSEGSPGRPSAGRQRAPLRCSTHAGSQVVAPPDLACIFPSLSPCAVHGSSGSRDLVGAARCGQLRFPVRKISHVKHGGSVLPSSTPFRDRRSRRSA